MRLTILVCALNLSRFDCDKDTAYSVIIQELESSIGSCGFTAEQILGTMPEMLDADGDGVPEAYAKVLCRE
jgi:hypothetical protein